MVEPNWLDKILQSQRPPQAQGVSPIIGVSGSPDKDGTGTASVKATMAMLRAQGATPVFLGDHDKRDPARDIEFLDGLVVLGNNEDIDPATYGEPLEQGKTHIETDQARANYERAAIELAIQRKVPLLGICGGLQRINVGGGEDERGKLWQHVPDHIGGSDYHMQMSQGIPPFVPVQCVQINHGSKLEEYCNGAPTSLYTPRYVDGLPEGWLLENSMHHQSVDPDHVRKGFIISAKASDGIPQAIEPDPQGPYKDQFILGVQWHPEFGASPTSPKIFGAITAHAREYALAQADKPKPALPPEGYPSQQGWVDRWREELSGRIAQIGGRG